jgi:hypothetical protein
MLPFLAMYAAFGQVTEAANRLVIQQQVRYGPISSQAAIVLRPVAGEPLGGARVGSTSLGAGCTGLV